MIDEQKIESDFAHVEEDYILFKNFVLETQKDVEKFALMVERKEMNINVNKEFEKKEECKAILK